MGRTTLEPIDRKPIDREKPNMRKLDAFTEAYIECALWSSADNSNESGGDPLDDNYGPEDLAPETRAQMIEECVAFQEANAADLSACNLTTECAGHDFWLTRNGHGSGFWDHYSAGCPEYDACERLTQASKEWGTVDLYVGNDGKIYV